MTAHRSVHGELAGLGVKVAAPAVWEILKASGAGPLRGGPARPGRSSGVLRPRRSWRGFLHGRPARRHPGLRPGRDRPGNPPHQHPRTHLAPNRERTTQQARNLIMDLGEHTHRVKFMIRDRGPDFTAAFGAVLAGASIQTPRMNAIAERWIGGCRRELPGRTLIWNQAICDGSCASTRPTTISTARAPLPARRRAAETATRAGQPRPAPGPKTRSRRRPDQRISPGRMTWMRLSARTG